MPSKTAKARVGVKGGLTMARHPTVRRATLRTTKPPAKVGWRVGTVVVSRRARTQREQLAANGRTLASFAIIYGPMAAEVFGLVQAPKPTRRVPAFAAGVLVGAGAMYVLNRTDPT
jgi:hypothetical protein